MLVPWSVKYLAFNQVKWLFDDLISGMVYALKCSNINVFQIKIFHNSISKPPHLPYNNIKYNSLELLLKTTNETSLKNFSISLQRGKQTKLCKFNMHFNF